MHQKKEPFLINRIKSVKYAKTIFKNTKFKIYVIDHNSQERQIDKIKFILNSISLERVFLKKANHNLKYLLAICFIPFNPKSINY